MNDARPRSAAGRDLGLVAAATAVVVFISIQVELSETLLAWTRPWESYQLDELPGILLFVAAALAWFAWRRAAEARAELARRIARERDIAPAQADKQRLSQ